MKIKIGNNQQMKTIHSIFSREQKSYFRKDLKLRTINLILSKYKNTKTRSQSIINFQYFYFIKTKNKKSNQT